MCAGDGWEGGYEGEGVSAWFVLGVWGFGLILGGRGVGLRRVVESMLRAVK